MAAVLTHSQSNLENVTFFIEECRKMGIEVLGPHVNESGVYFEVNKQGAIRFGLGAIKGAGDAAVESIIDERKKGLYKDIFDFAQRLGQKSVNKKTFESLALSGAFDCFPEHHRRHYVYAKEGDTNLVEKATKYAAKLQQDLISQQGSLFGASTGTEIPKPKADVVEPFTQIEKLHFEKEVVGVYISGHPLDDFKLEINTFCNTSISELNDFQKIEGKEIKVAGIVSSVEHKLTKTGRPFGKMVVEDYSGKFEFVFWSNDYTEFKNFLTPSTFLFIEGTVAKRQWGDQGLEFKVKAIENLHDLTKNRARGLIIQMSADDITRETVMELDQLFKKIAVNAH